MAEYIERESLIKGFCHSCDGWCDKVDCDCLNCKNEHRCETVLDIVNAPTADVTDVRRGHWEICCDGYYPYCSECGEEPPGRIGMTNFCPNCGADMRGDKDG